MSADNRTAWNAISGEYQAHHQIPTDDAHYGPRTPTEGQLRLVGDVRGEWLLEIGLWRRTVCHRISKTGGNRRR